MRKYGIIFFISAQLENIRNNSRKTATVYTVTKNISTKRKAIKGRKEKKYG